MHCRLWNVEGGGVHSVEREESGVLSGKCSAYVVCRVYSADCGVRSVTCKVWGGKCKV